MAEPFGLFQILQSFLSQTPQTPPSQPPTSETENVAETVAEQPPASERPTTVPAMENANAERERAVLEFMEAHDVRAKRIKKP